MNIWMNGSKLSKSMQESKIDFLKYSNDGGINGWMIKNWRTDAFNIKFEYWN